MKKIVLYSDRYLSESSEFLKYKEPKFLHRMVEIVFFLLVILFLIITFGKVDDVVHALGVVRPFVNVSSIKNAYSGEIEALFFKPGQFVCEGENLVKMKSDSVVADKLDLENQLLDINENLFGFERILKSYAENRISLIDRENCSESIKTRYEYFRSELEYLEAKIDRAEEVFAEEDGVPEYLKVLSDVKSAKFDLEQAKFELKEFEKGFLAEIHEEKRNLEVQKESLVQQLNQINLTLENYMIKSPVAGFVYEISSLNAGDYIFADQEILNIIPSENENLKIELQVPASKSGKLKIGQKVRFRFPAFPYYEFRGLEGNIKLIQPDSCVSQSGDFYYTVIADIGENVLKNHRDEQYKIKSGLEVDSRIVLKTETILFFLLRKLDFWV